MMGQFTLDLTRFASRTQQKADLAVRLIVVEVVRRVDMRSPVGQPALWKHPAPKGYVGGRFRGSNILAVDAEPHGEGRIDPSGAFAVAANFAAIPQEAAGHSYTIGNNVPYAEAIEYGHSSQAPQGVYGPVVSELQAIVDAAVAKARGAG
jgi:hypothetical protein